MDESISKAIAALDEAFSCGVQVKPLNDLLVGSVDAAYQVQNARTRRAVSSGKRIVGRKIGLTSPAVQKQLAVDEPDFGTLFADMAFDTGVDIALDGFFQPRIEAEIAFVLEKDLDRDSITIADVLGACGYMVPALEIADSRIKDWAVTIVDTIADNASAGGFVLGTTPVSLKGFDFELCGMVIEAAGEPVSTGAGAACLASPINAVRWLAQTMANANTPLQAGDIVLSGALGPMVPVSQGQAFEARISGLGSVRAAFGAGVKGEAS